LIAAFVPLFLHSLLSLPDESHQSLHFGFRRLQKPFDFLSRIVILKEFPDIEPIEPAIQDLETGNALLARSTIGEGQVMAKHPAVALFTIKTAIGLFRHCPAGDE
jgi:hypothetical protein